MKSSHSMSMIGTAAPAAADTFYDDVWQTYGELDAKSPAAFHRRRLVVKLAAKHVSRVSSILDVGCGQGKLLVELAERFPNARLCGADVSPESLAETARKNPRANVVAMDLAAQDFERRHAVRLGKFDLVVCSEVLEHVPDHELAMRRLEALLVPAGKLIVTVPGGKMSRFDQQLGEQRHYDTGELAALIRSASLEPLELMAWGFPFQNLYRSAVRVASRVEFRKAKPAMNQTRVSGTLSKSYALFGAALKPLFYLNRPYWGEQLLGVARRTRI